MPLYEHIISPLVMEELMGVKFAHLLHGTPEEQEVFFQNYCRFFREFGYDTVSFEHTITSIMPNSGCLGNSQHPAPITCPEDFEAYP